MTIKHLVISGGGPTMFLTMGAIQYLQEKEFLKIENIESIYGTSAGGIVAVILCLGFDWDTINNYFLNRPWHEAFPIGVSAILDAYTKKGIFDRSFAEKSFKPLFNAKDISMDITMKEFYEYSKIKIHLYSFELHEFKIVDISCDTHPDLPLLTALYMTTAFPILFAPYCVDGKCYLDGGIAANYPLKYCLDVSGNQEEDILGFKNNYDIPTNPYVVVEDSTIVDYVMSFLHKLIFNMETDSQQPTICNEITYRANYLSITYIQGVLSSCERRTELMETGKQAAIVFLQNIKERKSLVVL